MLALLTMLVPLAKSQSFSEVTPDVMDDLYNTHSEFADIDNDGDSDLIIIGEDELNRYETKIYLNNGAGVYSELSHTIPPISSGKIAISDYNLDGYADILIMGLTNGPYGLTTTTSVYRNNKNNSFTEVFDGQIHEVYKCDVIWEDLNGDFIPEIFITGEDKYGKAITECYSLSGNTYSLTSQVFTKLRSGSCEAADLNGDGLKDIIITGYNTTFVKETIIWKNKGNHQFEAVNVSLLKSITKGDFSVGDIDNDGDIDIFITGTDQSNNKVSELYINNGNFVFTVNSSFVSVSKSSSLFTDVNHDGWLDIIISGYDGITERTILYVNNKNNTFTLTAAPFKNVIAGSVSSSDIDNNGTLDIFESGLNTPELHGNVFKNAATADNAPEKPVNPNSDTDFNKVTISWNAPATVDETPSVALNYNIYLKNSDGTFMVYPLSDIAPSKKFLTHGRTGNVGNRTSVTFNNLVEGEYFWSVQTIDAGGKASEFIAEQSFVACDNYEIGSDIKICHNTTHTFNIDPKYSVNRWYTVKNPETIATTNSLDYTVTDTDKLIAEITITSLGCTQKDTVNVDTITLPEFSLGSDQSVCDSDNYTASVSIPFKDIEWSLTSGTLAGEKASNYIHKVEKNETITAIVTSNQDCKFTSSVDITKLELPTFTLGEDREVCYKQSSELKITGSYNRADWYNLNGDLLKDNNFSYTPFVDRDSTIRAKLTANNGCVFNDTITLQVRELPDYNLGKDTSVCYGNNVQLNVSNSFRSANWFETATSNSLGSGFTKTINIESDISIYSVVENNFGCIKNDTINFSKYDLPDLNIGTDKNICDGDNITITSDKPFTKVKWYSGSDVLNENSQSIIYKVVNDITIVAEATDNNKCVNTDTINIGKFDLPVIDLGADKKYCYSDTAKLNLSGYNSYLWSSDQSFISTNSEPNFTQKAERNSEVIVKVSDSNNCFNSDTVNFEVLGLPVVNIGKDTSICHANEFNFELSSDLKNIVWGSTLYGAKNGVRFSGKVNGSSRFYVKAENEAGCKNYDTLSMTEKVLPKYDLGTEKQVCYDEILDLSVDIPLKSINWSFSSGNTVINKTNTKFSQVMRSNDKLISEVKGNNGCVFKDTVNVVVNPLPQAIAGEDRIICKGTETKLGSASMTGKIEWESAVSGAEPLVSPDSDSEYRVKLTDSNGCVDYDTVKVRVNPSTVFNLASEKEACIGSSIKLGGDDVANGGVFDYTYNWFPGYNLSDGDSNTATVLVDSTLTYGIIAKSGECEPDTAYIKVIKHNLPVIETKDTVVIGAGQSVQLMASGGSEYLWSPDKYLNFNDVPDPIVRPDEKIIYTLQVTDDNGCVATQKVNVHMENRIFIPNLFTPNDDGNNDTFLIYGSGIEELSLTIYNSMGVKVYENSDVNDIQTNGWDGNYSGSMSDNGTYYWKINGFYNNGERVLFNGNSTGIINLIR